MSDNSAPPPNQPAEFDEQTSKAFDYAADATKQILTLSTGMIGLTVAFNKDFLRYDVATPISKAIMIAAWVLYVAAIFFGIWVLLALTGTLSPLSPTAIKPSIRGANVTFPSLAQIISFVLAISLTIAYVVYAR